MQEDCVPQAQSDLVQINTIPNAGQWIRRRGEDLSIGKVALSAGTVLRPQHLALPLPLAMHNYLSSVR